MPANRPDLDGIRQRCDIATPGPWKLWGSTTWQELPDGGLKSVPFQTFLSLREAETGKIDHDRRRQAVTNWEFVAHARQDIPELLAYIDHLERIVQGDAAE